MVIRHGQFLQSLHHLLHLEGGGRGAEKGRGAGKEERHDMGRSREGAGWDDEEGGEGEGWEGGKEI